jgi:hypothetical protein
MGRRRAFSSVVDHDDDKGQLLPTSARAQATVSALPRPFPPLSGAHTGCLLGAQTPDNRREFPGLPLTPPTGSNPGVCRRFFCDAGFRSYCLPCRRSRVRIPSAASEKACICRPFSSRQSASASASAWTHCGPAQARHQVAPKGAHSVTFCLQMQKVEGSTHGAAGRDARSPAGRSVGLRRAGRRPVRGRPRWSGTARRSPSRRS